MPVAQDESYYFLWSRYLDFGYFDHPPLVALMAATSRFAGGSPFVARLGTVFVAMIAYAFTLGVARKSGLKGGAPLIAAAALANVNLLGLIFGFLTTPDTVLICSWIMALHETLAAVRGAKGRWITAGAAAGLGLQAKYTMGLYAFVCLWWLIADARRKGFGKTAAIRTVWPWGGVLAALLVWSPHLLWNAQNDWITVKFQLRHGLTMARPEMSGETLPRPLAAAPDSAEWHLAEPFRHMAEAQKTDEKRPGPFDGTMKALNQYVGYYASQVALWGALLPVILWALWQRRREGRGRQRYADQLTVLGMHPEARTLLTASVVVPLAVFGLISLGSKVEANWSGMYIAGAAMLLAPLAVRHARAVKRAAIANAAILFIALVHARTGWLPLRPHRDRVLLETHGYQDLAAKLRTLDAPVFADTFQLVSMTRFYAPGLAVRQWPGITRDSELVRRKELNDVTLAFLHAAGHFYLVTTDLPPPRLPTFEASALAELRDCKGNALQEIGPEFAAESAARCRKPIHEWYLVRYEARDITGF